MGREFCNCQLGHVVFIVCESSLSLLIFCLHRLSIFDKRVGKSPVIIVGLSLYPLVSTQFMLIHIENACIFLLGVSISDCYVLFTN